ncbi:cytochrome P450 CYP72A219-like [Impatiens glandulifera]|uniref:cytochrome P450 CYP72A219-like n=1 Tax=Impatiens glandulifera TaxID=253017 RepID=UPI001FB0CD97|nr:cytochrome P450 CYP72A219-like [Impatiens glandulifera]
MEVKISLIIALTLIILLLLYMWKALDRLWLKPKKLEKLLRLQGLKGNPYRLFYGDTIDMATMAKEASSTSLNVTDDILPFVLPFHHHIMKKHGKNCFSWSGPLPRINIMDPELINEILLKNNTFRKPEQSPVHKLLNTGLVTYEDEKWTKHRKIMNPAFYAEKLKQMLPHIYTSCREIINKWEELIPKGGSSEVDVSPYLRNLTSDVISRVAFGSCYEEGRRIFELQQEQSQLVYVAMQSLIPGWRFLPNKTNKRMKEIYNEIDSLVLGIIENKMKAMNVVEEEGDGDLLAMLLRANLEEIEEHDAGMSIKEVIEECKLFYFAGQETTANLLTWAVVLLSQHPNWQERAREEVQKVLGERKPDYEGLNRLKVVTMILNEVLRLYPPSIMLMRIVHEETKLGEMTLPGGVRVIVPTIFVHRDEEVWGEDAKEFKPERFSEGIAKAMKKQVCFFPFGGGPRICIGNNMAMFEAKVALAMILQHFKFELSPYYNHAPGFVVTLRPQKGAHLILHRI